MTRAVLKTVSSLSFRASAEPSTSFDPPDDRSERSSPEPGIPSADEFDGAMTSGRTRAPARVRSHWRLT